jgi:hypothetical protein
MCIHGGNEDVGRSFFARIRFSSHGNLYTLMQKKSFMDKASIDTPLREIRLIS